MKVKNYILSLFTIFLLLLAGGCSKIPTNANTAFQNFTLALFREDLASNTLNLHFSLKNPDNYGIEETSISLGSFPTDPSASRVFYENCEASLKKFSYQSLSDKNKLTYDILSTYINTEKTGMDFILYAEPLSPITGIHTTLPVLLSEYPLYTEKDVHTYLSLLKTMPEYFSSLIQFEESKSASGLFMSDNLLDEILTECHAFLNMKEENYMQDTFIERLSAIPHISEAARLNFLSEHEALISDYIYPSYSQLIQALESLRGTGRNSQGLCYFPKGKEYFTYLIASETGSSKSVEKIKSMIETQIDSDFLQLVSLTKAIVQEIDSSSPLQTIQTLSDGIKKAFPDSMPVNLELKFVPKALEMHLSPAFYFIPAIDNMSDNVIYINQGYEMDDLDLFTTLAHESYPGHLYQTTYFAATDPDPIRHILSFKGYVEGWATYAEMCSYSIAPMDQKSASYEQKNNSLILGLHAMADLGIHYEGWSLEEFIQFFSTYGIQDRDSLNEIYNYILGNPTNYLSYYLGYLEILELKEKCNLSQKDFHEKILRIGPAPFSVVEKWLLD